MDDKTSLYRIAMWFFFKKANAVGHRWDEICDLEQKFAETFPMYLEQKEDLENEWNDNANP